jgi:hypothetical protein
MHLGEIRLAATTHTHARSSELSALALDLNRYVSLEPRLRSARMLDSQPPKVGSEIEITAEIPFSVPLMRALMGPPQGIAKILRWEPDHELEIYFEASRFVGHVTVVLANQEQGTLVDVNGFARPHARLAQLALLPIKPLIEDLAKRSILRAISRIDQAISQTT